MKLTRNKIFFGIFTFGLITNLLVYFNIQNFYLRAIFSFIFLITIPGLLIMLMLKIKKIGPWEYLVYTLGLSIAFLMFTGLAVNWILPWLHITDKPLSLTSLLINFDALLLIFGIIAYVQNKDFSSKIKFPKLDWLNKLFLITPIIFTILSILGAITLNNGGPNYLTVTMLGGIAIYVLFAVLFRNKLNNNIYPWAIWIMSVSLLLMYSLRSWHILGWDINQEYLVFNLANNTKHWDVNALNNAYNLCLSITILPTIFTSFLNLNNEYIYKLIFPVIFSIVPLTIYLLTEKFLNKKIAFLSSFFFISQIWFFQQMPTLTRQEIALVFFAQILILKYTTEINQNTKYFLSVIFGVLITLSHYSTAYVWIAIMIIYYITSSIVKITIFKDLKQYFTLKYILLIITFTFVWESQLTTVSNNFVNFITSTITSISKGLSSDMISEGFNRLTFKNLDINNFDNVINNYQTTTEEYQTKGLSLYPKEKYPDYFPKPISSEKLIPLVQTQQYSIIITLLKIIKIALTIILPFIGIFYLLSKCFHKVNRGSFDSFWINNNINYLIITIATLPLILLIIFLPIVKIEYNITRLYIQSLIVLAPLTILGGSFLLSKIKSNVTNSIILETILILFFIYSTGFVSQIIGGWPFIHLNNIGEDYDRYYITQSDIKSAKWLAKNRINNSSVYADEVAGLRLTSFGLMIDYKYDILPSTIDIPSYVYLSKTNVQKGKVYKRYDIDFLAFTTPIEFLNENKNLIYNNDGSEVFK
ncbi:DUF2206 domain-containing protein [Patescibacteria group bacterium]|nr:DUF2206 domain-containing protein [Patescibacteria group bacterium]